MLGAYRELEQRVGGVSAGRGTKMAMVHEFLERAPGEFSSSDIQARRPTVSLDLIRRILKNERKAGRLECPGLGPNARCG